MTKVNVRKCTGLLGALLGSLLASSVFAQDPVTITLSDETGAADETIAVTVAFTGNGESASFQGDFVFDDTNVTSVDFSDCNLEFFLAGFTGGFDNPGGATDRLRLGITTDPPPLTDFSCVIAFEMDGGAADGTVIPLAWNEDLIELRAEDPIAEANATDGSITIGDAPGECSLSITPSPHDFGSVTVGNTASQSFTISNGGEADCTNVTVAVSGDAEFNLASDDCGTLAAGASCSADVDFTPSGEGAFSGNLDATADEDSASAALSGEGTTAPGDDGVQTVAIPTMQPLGLALLALVMLMIGAIGVRTFRS